MILEEMLGNLREVGWTVAVHNDYRQGGKLMTFWLFTHPDGRWLKGEAESDRQAVMEVMRQAFKGKTIIDAVTASGGQVERTHRIVEM
jgi:hypothetical protein